MERSLDDLVHCLLDDIALCGEQGASTEQVLNFLTQYASKSCSPGKDVDVALSIDHAFQGQVWRWLTKHPDIKVGKDGKAKQWSLTAIQTHNERFTSKSKEKNSNTGQKISSGEGFDKSLDPVAATDIPAIIDNDVPFGQDNNEPLVPTLQTARERNSDVVARDAELPVPSDSPTHTQPSIQASSNDSAPKSQEHYIKVYACDDRLWWAAAGHGPDHEKIPPHQFSCLSIIASFREEGISQPELVRLSGQDNRSVPRRTQSLQEQGYIEKKTTFYKGHRTSQCILKRFANSFSMEKNLKNIVEASYHKETGPDDPKSGRFSKSTYLGMIRYRDRIEKMFELLQQNPVYGWNELKKDVCVLHNWFQSRVLAVAVRRWESYGVVKRVRALASYQPADGEPCQCVKLIRLPEEKEWLLFYKFESPSKLNDPSEEDVGLDDDDVDATEGSRDIVRDLTTMDDSEQGDTTGNQAPLPFWRPHQPFGQFLYDAVSFGSTNGMSTMALKEFALGSFFERPLEHTLTRLEDLWQMSQPLHLRHLAVIRDIATVSRVPHYVHFTFPNYKIKVEQGDVEWEAVEIVKPGKAKGNERVTAVAELDEFGFPDLDKTKFVSKQHCATLEQCVEADKRSLFSLKGQDPMVVKNVDGTLDVSWENNPYPKVRRSKAQKKEGMKEVAAIEELVPYVERRGGRRIPKPRSDLHYFPSRFSHTRLVMRHSFSTATPLVKSQVNYLVRSFVSLSGVSGWHDKNKPGPPKPRGRPPKVPRPQVRRPKPRTATINAGNKFEDLDGKGGGPAVKSAKRNAAAAELCNGDDKSKRRRKEISPEARYQPSAHAHTVPLMQPCLSLDSVNPIRCKPMATRKFAARRPTIKSQNAKGSDQQSYEEQAEIIERQHAGFYIGDRVKLRRVGSRGRAPMSRLAIFKSTRLVQFSWFLRDEWSPKTLKHVRPSHTPRRELPWANNQFQPLQTPQQPSKAYPDCSSRNADHEPSPLYDEVEPAMPEATTHLPKSPTNLPGGDALALQMEYASPYTPRDTAHCPNTTDANTSLAQTAYQTPVISDISRTGTKPVTQQSPYARASSYPVDLTPDAPMLLSQTFQGHESMSSPQDQQLHRSGTTPASRVASVSPTVRKSLKRRYPSGIDEAPVQNDSASRKFPKTPLSKRKKVEREAQRTSTKHRSQNPSTLIVVLKDLDPTRYRRLIQAFEGTRHESDTNPPDRLDSLGGASLLEETPVVPHFGSVEETHELAAGIQSIRNVSGEDGQIPLIEDDPFQDETPALGSVQKTTFNTGDPVMAEAVSKEQAPLLSSMLSPQSQRQLAPLEAEDGDVTPFAGRPSPLQNSNNERASHSEANAQSISSEESYATARSGTYRSCSKSDIVSCKPAETGNNRMDSVDQGESGTAGPRSQMISPPDSADMTKADGIIHEDALNNSVPSSSHETNKSMTMTSQKEITMMNRDIGLSNQDIASQYTDSVVATGASKPHTVESEGRDAEIGQVQHTEKETIVDPNEDTVVRQDSQERELRDLEIVDSVESIHQGQELQPERMRRPFSNQQVISSGGSVGVLRRKIIMGILEEAGGLYPSGTELWFPFMAAWLTKGIASKPDNRTIRFAAKALIDTGKARQLTFTFKTKKGVAVQKKILMLVNVVSTDPKVLALKRQMIDKHPQCYFPPKPELPSALKRGLDGRDLLEQLAGEETLPTIQELEQKKTEERAVKAQMEREKKERKAAWQLGAAERRKAYLRDYNAEKSLEKSRHSPVPVAPELLEHMPKWQMLPPDSWSSWFNVFPVRSEVQVNREAELAKLRQAMSDAERYRMLDSMSPYNTFWTESKGSNLPSKLAHSRKKQAVQPIEKPADGNVDQNASLDPDNQEKNPVTVVQVEKPKKVVIDTMPPDLDGMLSQYSPPSLLSLQMDTSNLAKFNKIVDRVVFWELDTELAQTADCNTLAFINHDFLGVHELAGSPRQEPYDFFNVFQDQENVMIDLVRTRIPKALRVDFHIPAKLSKPYTPEKIVPRKRRLPKNTKPEDTKVPKQKRQRVRVSQSSAQSKLVGRLTRLKEKVSQLEPIKTDSQAMRNYGNLRLRGPASLRYLPEAEERRIVLAVIIVRTLTGGLEKNIDWPLVTSIFKGQYTELFLHRKWSYMIQKYRPYLGKLQDNFQKLFAEAYEDELVPPIDFDHLDQYDWNAVVAWTDEHLDALYSSPQLAEDGAELPLQRSDIDDFFDLEPPAVSDTAAEYFELNGPATIPRRHAIAHNDPAVKMLIPHNSKQANGAPTDTQSTVNDVIIAKSWVKANIVTPVNTYSPEFASSKFSLLPDSAIQKALKSLFNAKQITRETKTMYELASAYVLRLNRNIGVVMLKDAAATKMQLDITFQSGESAAIQQVGGDGYWLTMVNLVMRGKVNAKAKDLLMTRWGLLPQGQYETRKMDKKKLLHFDLQVDPTERYEIGCPLPLPLPEAPLQPEQRSIEQVERAWVPALQMVPRDAVDPPVTQGASSWENSTIAREARLRVTYAKATRKEPTPLWFDINGSLVPELWETCVATVLSRVVPQLGIPLQTLCLALRDTLEEFEVEALVQWLVDAGAAQWSVAGARGGNGGEKEGKGVKVKEGWWGVLWQSVEKEEHIRSRDVPGNPGINSVTDRRGLGDETMATERV